MCWYSIYDIHVHLTIVKLRVKTSNSPGLRNNDWKRRNLPSTNPMFQYVKNKGRYNYKQCVAKTKPLNYTVSIIKYYCHYSTSYKHDLLLYKKKIYFDHQQ